MLYSRFFCGQTSDFVEFEFSVVILKQLMINSRHSGDQVKKVSDMLAVAEKELIHLREHFDIDILVDTIEFYIISGIKNKPFY